VLILPFALVFPSASQNLAWVFYGTSIPIEIGNKLVIPIILLFYYSITKGYLLKTVVSVPKLNLMAKI